MRARTGLLATTSLAVALALAAASCRAEDRPAPPAGAAASGAAASGAALAGALTAATRARLAALAGTAVGTGRPGCVALAAALRSPPTAAALTAAATAANPGGVVEAVRAWSRAVVAAAPADRELARTAAELGASLEDLAGALAPREPTGASTAAAPSQGRVGNALDNAEVSAGRIVALCRTG